MEVKRLFLPKICHTYLASIKLVTVVSYLKKIRKYIYINHVTHSLLLLASVFFHEISATFVISKNTVTFFESLKVVLIKMAVILIMLAKLATLSLLKIKVF